MRRYDPSPNRTEYTFSKIKGSRLDLSEHEAHSLLNNDSKLVELPRNLGYVGVHNGKLYMFVRSGDVFHANPVTGYEIDKDYPGAAHKLASIMGISSKQLGKMKD